MFQDIINYGNRQGGKQAIADCGLRILDLGIERYAMCDMGCEI